MPDELIPRKRKRDFWQNLLPPEQQEDEGLFGLRRYQPLPEFERPGQQGPAPAPGMLRLGQGNLAPAPRLRGGDVGVRTDTFAGQPTRAPAPIDYQPSPSGYESLVRAPGLQAPESTLESYGEQYRREYPKPELAPAPGLSKKRRIGAAIATFAAELGQPGTGYGVGQQILYGPREREEREHERGLETWQEGREEARDRDIAEGRQAGERRAREVHERYESPQDELSRRAQEAEAQGLTGEAARRYILTGQMAAPDRPDTSTTAIELWAEAIEVEKGRPPTSAEIMTYKRGIERAPRPSAAGKALAERTKQRAMKSARKEYQKKIGTLEKDWQKDPYNEGNWINYRTGEQISNDEYLALRQQIEDELIAEEEAADESYLFQLEAAEFEPGEPIDYRARHLAEKRGGAAQELRAVNPKTGEEVVYRGGKWVPVPR